jgi:hypothetical protein
MAWNLARLGRDEESLAALVKVEELDPLGKLGASHLREVFTEDRSDAGMIISKDYENWRFADD